MNEFWAFNNSAFLYHSSRTYKLSICALAHSNCSFGVKYPGFPIGNIKEKYRQNYALPLLLDTKTNERPTTPWAQELIPTIEKIHENFGISKGRIIFSVAVPLDEENTVAFAFSSRNFINASKTEARNPDGLSQLAKDSILTTCDEVIRNMSFNKLITDN